PGLGPNFVASIPKSNARSGFRGLHPRFEAATSFHPPSTLQLFTKCNSCASLSSMRKPANALIVSSIFLSASFIAAQTLPRPSLEMATSGGRDGACSASMKDGRSLVTGGKDASGPLTSAKYFEGAGRLKTVSPMLAARTDHVCLGLDDGTVLVAG